MNRPDPLQPWWRLTAAARRAPIARDEAMPYGFATRVVARAFADMPVASTSLFTQLSWRAFGVAAALALGFLAVNFQSLTQQQPIEDTVLNADPVSAVLDLSSGS
ncbi:hypothetical protein K0B96_04490 [Horticoccus luteus]|uniref:Uncharacterized protein n=1 Tax=Horticoccus luteus TaxID=2862869 RepID=A0A8F9XH34_9BACT|nr:hypothetical protein [Horticoccus luteus]QYM79882.1 hypothetical protein K0B96_04490 [Horticoccus luteus]